MARRTITELHDQASLTFPDNSVGAISPQDLRLFCLDLLDTIRPSYGALTITAPIFAASSTDFATFPWETVVVEQAPEYVANLADGSIIRVGTPATARISFSIDAQFPNNRTLTFALFMNDIEQPWAIANRSTSGVDTISFAFSAIVYSADPTIKYDIRVKSTDTSGDLDLFNGIFVVENVPVNVVT